MIELPMMNGFFYEEKKDGSYAIYENENDIQPIIIAENATKMIEYCNTH